MKWEILPFNFQVKGVDMRDRCHCRMGPFDVNMIPAGILKPLILRMLMDRPMHGYELMKEISMRTRGFWNPGAGSIYPAINSLEREGYVARVELKQGDRSKIVYSITDKGKESMGDSEKFKKEWNEGISSLSNIW